MKVTGTYKGNTLLVLFLAAAFTVQAQDLAYQHPQSASSDTPLPSSRSATIPLRAALQKLEKAYRISFAYNAKLVANKEVPAQVLENSEHASLQELLQTLLKPLELQVKQIEGNVYVIKAADMPQEMNGNGGTGIAATVMQTAPVKGRVKQKKRENKKG